MKKLTQRQIDMFREDGFLYPIDAMSMTKWVVASKVSSIRTDAAVQFGRGCNFKPHLLYEWADQLVHNTALLDAVEDILGPDILLLSSACFPKNAGEGAFVAWHQDASYFGLEPPMQITAWAALSDGRSRLRALARLHKLAAAAPRSADQAQHAVAGSDCGRGLWRRPPRIHELKAGQFRCGRHLRDSSLGAKQRVLSAIGISMNFIPTHVQGHADKAVGDALVRCIDRYKHLRTRSGRASVG